MGLQRGCGGIKGREGSEGLYSTHSSELAKNPSRTWPASAVVSGIPEFNLGYRPWHLRGTTEGEAGRYQSCSKLWFGPRAGPARGPLSLMQPRRYIQAFQTAPKS